MRKAVCGRNTSLSPRTLPRLFEVAPVMCRALALGEGGREGCAQDSWCSPAGSSRGWWAVQPGNCPVLVSVVTGATSWGENSFSNQKSICLLSLLLPSALGWTPGAGCSPELLFQCILWALAALLAPAAQPLPGCGELCGVSVWLSDGTNYFPLSPWEMALSVWVASGLVWTNLLHWISSHFYTWKGCACIYIFFKMELFDIWSHGC